MFSPAAVNSIDSTNKTITVNKTLSIPNSSDLTVYTQENKLGWYSYKIVVKQLAEEYYNAYLGGFQTIASTARINASGINNYLTTYITSLLADNVNKIPADLGSVAPEQNQFGTSDTRLNIRVGSDFRQLPYGGGNNYINFGSIYPGNFYFGASTASIQGYGKVLDLGLSADPIDSDVTGLQQSGNNPPAIIVSGANQEVFGLSGSNNEANGFSIAEIVPRVSKLEIYWETSTSGLVTELNSRIAAGASVLPVVPDVPLEPVEEGVSPASGSSGGSSQIRSN